MESTNANKDKFNIKKPKNISTKKDNSIKYDKAAVSSEKTEKTKSSSSPIDESIPKSNQDEIEISPTFNIRDEEDINFSYLSDNSDEIQFVAENFLIWESFNIPYHNVKRKDIWFDDEFSIMKKNSTVIENGTTWNIADLIVLKCLSRHIGFFTLLIRHKISKKLYILEVISKYSCIDKKIEEKVHIINRISRLVKDNIFFVQILLIFETSSSFCFLYEHVEYGDLTALIKKKRRLSENQAKIFMAEIAFALNFLHENGIIYRNISFNNVLLAKPNWVKLSDFKNCVFADEYVGRAGSYWFMAPEMFLGFRYNCAVDFWSLGMLGFKLMSGFPKKGSKCCEEIIKKIPQKKKRGKFPIFRLFDRDFLDFPSYVSRKARKIIEQLMQVEPNCRLGNGMFEFKEIQWHPFFAGINWNELQLMTLPEF